MSNFFDVIGSRLANAHSRAPDSRSKVFHCVCGQPVFLNNTHCLACDTQLGFDPERGEVLAIQPGRTPDTWVVAQSGTGALAPLPEYLRCANLRTQAVCNWLLPETDWQSSHIFCLACRLNRTIPDLSIEQNGERWRMLEAAKRRLVAQLLVLGLSVTPSMRPGDGGLAFDLIGPDALGNAPLTGHDAGLITINVLEADDAYRAQLRADMHEPYRTLLGHFRHEVGHYYWDRLIYPTPWLARFREVFGDERQDYAAALKTNYEDGPPADWASRFISTYAACHPWEDWAETWAHYLHMMDTLDTALSFGITTRVVECDYASFSRNVLYDPNAPDADEFLDLVNTWVELTGVLNELSRSMGQRDFYPFVLPHAVVGKLQFVHRVVKARSLALSAANQSDELP